MFGQTFELHDLIVIGLLTVLEGILSIDNALVLGILARRLPKHLQARALTYGLAGAVVFRVIAIGLAAFLLKWTLFKLLGGGYLLYVAGRHLLFPPAAEETDGPIQLDSAGMPVTSGRTYGYFFWSTVVAIELTDIAFAVDSIVAAMALVGSQQNPEGNHPKLWVVLTGGMLGVILMRFAAVVFIRLLEKFPRFETAAYLLVAVIGAKMTLDYAVNPGVGGGPHRLNFHDLHAIEFWAFWLLMAVCFGVGFIPKRRQTPA